MKKRTQIPKRYLYIDKEGIRSLYAQTVERLEIEFTTQKNKSGKKRISGILDIGKALGNFLKLVNLSGDAEYERMDGISYTSKSKVTAEQILKELLEYLNKLGEPTIFADLLKATQYCSKNKDRVFVVTETTFDVPQFYGENGVNTINCSKYILYEKNMRPTYDYSDKYYKKVNDPKIVMSSSLSKYPNIGKKHMGHTSHEAIFFRGHKGENIPLKVFGIIFSLPNYFQIKPFSIWF